MLTFEHKFQYYNHYFFYPWSKIVFYSKFFSSQSFQCGFFFLRESSFLVLTFMSATKRHFSSLVTPNKSTKFPISIILLMRLVIFVSFGLRRVSGLKLCRHQTYGNLLNTLIVLSFSHCGAEMNFACSRR